MPDTTSAPRPFIIWTLQRTGGTNLAHQITLRSGLQGTQHEPFNPGRMFGHITEQWMRDGDRDALRRGVDEICQRGVIIKHCVEMVPWEITEALARASAAAGYHHLFLYRRNGLDRLLSLHFARRTGVWGPGTANMASGRTDVDRGAFSEVLPVEKLIRHEQTCVEGLRRAWALLQSLGAMPRAVAYEDVFRTSDQNQPERILQPILHYLGLSKDEASDRVWISEVVGKGDQGTRDRYRDFPGVDELTEHIKAIPPFSPGSDAVSILARVASELPPWIERCLIDVLPARVFAGVGFELGGVLVLGRDAPAGLGLRIEGREGVILAQWGLPSQRMARLHPQAANSANARFLVQNLSFQNGEERLVLKLSGPDLEDVEVAEVLQLDAPDYSQIFIEPEDRLIFDVGGNDGSDTWYYLRKGFRVVVVEAIPELAESLRTRFSAQIAAKRLVVEQVAIADQEGEVSMTINDERLEWSSAHGASKASAGANRTVTVPSTTLAALMVRHGTPYYVKIDIEGGELSAVDSLSELPRERLPPLLSFEVNLSFGEILERLYQFGYRSFQLVRQGSAYLPTPCNTSAEGLDYPCLFSSNMSGPFGKDLPQSEWVGLVEVIRRILQAQADSQTNKSRGENPGWYDVHAARCVDRHE